MPSSDHFLLQLCFYKSQPPWEGAHPGVQRTSTPRREGLLKALSTGHRGVTRNYHYFHSHPRQQNPLHSPRGLSRWWAGPAGQRGGEQSGGAWLIHSLWLLQEAVEVHYMSSLFTTTNQGLTEWGQPCLSSDIHRIHAADEAGSIKGLTHNPGKA